MLRHGANDRNFMLTRMPAFGDGHLDRLHAALLRLDRGQDATADAITKRDADATQIADGRKLVGAGGLSCIKCHAYGGEKGGGIGVIDLLGMPERLRPEWFARYLRDPTKYRPGTRMPNSFPEGRSSYTDLYDGDPDRQIAAMWAYLDAGTAAKEPAGLRPGAILLQPNGRPLIYRNFFEGVTGRGIGVGFPEEVNLIWDAERMGLATLWKHEFVDASRHWSGRGQGRVGPAGDQVLALERWTPLARLDRIDADWPDAVGRELGYRFIGYRIDPDQSLVFRYRIGSHLVSDSVRVVDGTGVDRELRIEPDAEAGEAASSRPLIWRIAVADSIERAGDGGYRLGSATVTLEGGDPDLISIGGRSELRMQLSADGAAAVRQTIRW